MKQSAGLLVYRQNSDTTEVLIVHPGGPYFSNKDEGVWSIPKGNIDHGEDGITCAKREFREEIGIAPPGGHLKDLGEAIYPKKTKSIMAWAVEGDVDLADFKSQTVKIEWPPRSGRKQDFPEVDRAEWLSLELAAKKLFAPQVVFLERLAKILGQDFKIAPAAQNQLDLF